MTATVLFTEHPAGPGPHRSIVEARSRYRGVFGTTWYDDSISALVTRNERMHAVMMPELLGVAVLGALGANAAAVISVGAAERCVWTFLTEAPASPSRTRSLALFTRFVIQAGPGALIALPTPGNPRRQWVCEPAEAALPAYELVADAVVAASGR
ncbi:hypothetical protein NONO_c29250 [Nocardia nova SH22a]|uniref:Uncharacterized protein n=1 Tax=Nocardia nova SH22a TaxID=1415166 RepID=W5TEX2_9NOCA|nr:hypothetical protein [Nocardia nova]AHH17714.1 hypothetical protein NONO_c29250 [Nocardia nova SH22a]